MTGIVAYAAYLPLYRLNRAEIGRAWGKSGKGEKAVGAFDEDSLTMAVAAAQACLDGKNVGTVDGVLFASTTAPYHEKQSAATIAAVLGLGADIYTADFAGSLRCGTNALRAAVDAVNSGSLKRVLVLAADCRLSLPNGANEMAFGDGAAALLIGKEGVAASIDSFYSMADEIIDVFRSDRDRYVKSWEVRFVRDDGHGRVVPQAVKTALAKNAQTAADFSKVVMYSPDQRQLQAVTKSIKLDPARVQDTFFNEFGDTGSAQVLITLAAALEAANAGDRILAVSYGNGSDVVTMTATPDIAKAKPARGIGYYLNTKLMVATYEKYLRWREIVEVEPPATAPMEQPSPVALWRDNKSGLDLHGVKCRKCGTPQYPAQRVCIECGSKDDFEDYSFSDKPAVLATFSHDSLGVSADPPTTIAAVDFKEGGRITCDMTDRDPAEIKIGMPIEMVFRVLRYIGGFYTYWWKARPKRD
ncbi:MAG: hydroxymethylglutaryl-CoA synthase family protein [Dehalococcoidia bacterium]|nr:hydroxymethylglutaryl-CoA synthase family protein [Dehalococcoidia bacterium]